MNEVYVRVIKRLGGSRLSVDCSDGRTRSAIIPGKFRRKIWMNVGDILLCELLTTGKDDVCTVNHKYSNQDIIALKSQYCFDFGKEEILEEINFEYEDESQKIPEQRIIPDFNNLSDDDIDIADL